MYILATWHWSHGTFYVMNIVFEHQHLLVGRYYCEIISLKDKRKGHSKTQNQSYNKTFLVL